MLELKEAVREQDVLLVGGGNVDFQTVEHATQKKVIRLNLNYGRQGGPMDIGYCNGAGKVVEWYCRFLKKEQVRPELIVCCESASHELLTAECERLQIPVTTYSRDESWFVELYRQYKTGTPLTGIIVLTYLLELCAPRSVELVAFDFFHDSRNAPVVKRHNMAENAIQLLLLMRKFGEKLVLDNICSDSIARLMKQIHTVSR